MVGESVDNDISAYSGNPGHTTDRRGGLLGTIVQLAHPDRVGYRRRCVDPWCGRSLPVP